jgi:hypothetical protein
VARSTSAKKIAQLAHKGKGKKVRFQGGSLFPIVILAIVILGSVLIAYARQSGQPVDATVSANQTYATSFGVYKCDAWITGLPTGPLDVATASPEDPAAIVADGIVTWKPQVLAGERKAVLGTILDLYGIDATDGEISFPPTINSGEKISEVDTKCGDKDATLSVVVWDSIDAVQKLSIAAFDRVRLTGDGMVIVLAFTASGTEVPQPASGANLGTYQQQG